MADREIENLEDIYFTALGILIGAVAALLGGLIVGGLGLAGPEETTVRNLWTGGCIIALAAAAMTATALWLRKVLGRAAQRREKTGHARSGTKPREENGSWELTEQNGRTTLLVTVESEHRPGTVYEWSCRMRPAHRGLIRVGRPALQSVNGAKPPWDTARWKEKKLGQDKETAPEEFEQLCGSITLLCNQSTQATEKMIIQEEQSCVDDAERERDREKLLRQLLQREDPETPGEKCSKKNAG